MKTRSSLTLALVLAMMGCGASGSTGLFGSTSSGSGGASTTGPGGSGGGASGSTGSSSSGGNTSSASSSSGSTSGSSSTSSSAASSSSSGNGGVDAGPLGPTVQILHPGSGVDRKKGVSILFHGIGNDPTDGMLSGNALVWTDSLEGKFGTGDPVMWAPMVVGAHTMTLTGTDSLNYSATSTVTFNIVP